METANLRQFWCFLKGDEDLFEVTADVEQSVFQLKAIIKGNQVDLSSLNPSRIVLWKVSMSQLPMYTFHSRCVARQNYRYQTRKYPFKSSSAIDLRVFRQAGRAFGYRLKPFSQRCSQGLSTFSRGTTR